MALQAAFDVVAVGEVRARRARRAPRSPSRSVRRSPVLDHRQPRRQAGAGGQQVQVAAGVQVRDQQGAGRLAADQDRVAGFDVLQARGQRPSCTLMLKNSSSSSQFALAIEYARASAAPSTSSPDHHELAVVEAEAVVAAGGETEVRVRPVADVEHRSVPYGRPCAGDCSGVGAHFTRRGALAFDSRANDRGISGQWAGSARAGAIVGIGQHVHGAIPGHPRRRMRFAAVGQQAVPRRRCGRHQVDQLRIQRLLLNAPGTGCRSRDCRGGRSGNAMPDRPATV